MTPGLKAAPPRAPWAVQVSDDDRAWVVHSWHEARAGAEAAYATAHVRPGPDVAWNRWRHVRLLRYVGFVGVVEARRVQPEEF